MKKIVCVIIALALLAGIISFPPPSQAEESAVRVLLSTEGRDTLTLELSGTYVLNGMEITGGALTVATTGSEVAVSHSELGELFTGAEVTLTSQDEESLFTLTDGEGAAHSYRGDATFDVSDGNLRVVNTVSMEAYILGVALAEAGPNASDDELREAMFAARSYARKQVKERAKKAYDVKDSGSENDYFGYDPEAANAIAWAAQVVDEPDPTPEPEPTEEPTPEPTEEPTPEPTEEPTPEPTEEPTPEPTEEPTPEPTEEPTPEPTEEPTPELTEEPTPEPTEEPTPEPTEEPVATETPSPFVNLANTVGQSFEDRPDDSFLGTVVAEVAGVWEEPSQKSTLLAQCTADEKVYVFYQQDEYYFVQLPGTDIRGYMRTEDIETEEPIPTAEPTEEPTPEPTAEPTEEPTPEPTAEPTEEPTPEPTEEPTPEPTAEPTEEPTPEPTDEPTAAPTDEPTPAPTDEPTPAPTVEPTAVPTAEPTEEPTPEPTDVPTPSPTLEPEQPEGTILGFITSTVLAIREAPDGSGKVIGNWYQDQIVYIYYQEGEYYYLNVGGTDVYGYGSVRFIVPESLVPLKDEPTPAPTETPEPTPTGPLTEPTKTMIRNAVSGQLSTGNVNMRSGPSTKYSLVDSKLKKGTALTIYAKDGDWYFLKVDSTGKYGYILGDFVQILDDDEPTPKPTKKTDDDDEPSIRLSQGDVNGDGLISAADAALVLRYDAGWIELSDAQLRAADMDGDDQVTDVDAKAILRYVAMRLAR